ncbi:MAG: hypothetical protein K2P51_07910 [Rhabdochlamydiaceae bacterium]|nr:hypothetical protein [Rhabdochlamydiaceae bacterium]
MCIPTSFPSPTPEYYKQQEGLNLVKQLNSIDDANIDLLSLKIIDLMLSRIGNQNIINELLSEQIGTATLLLTDLELPTKPTRSQKDIFLFHQKNLPLIRFDLKAAFGPNAWKFTLDGLTLTTESFDPTSAAMTPIPPDDIPSNYKILLELDHRSSLSKQELVFHLSEQSHGIQITTHTFKLSELEADYLSLI